MDEDAVFEAFAYWERQGLAERLSDNPPSFALRPVRSAIEQRKQVDETMYAYREYDFAIQALFGGENVEARYRVMANDWLTVLGFSQEAALVRRMQELGRAWPGRGYGAQFGQWLYEAEPRPYFSCGNGSAMRVSAAGVCAAPS